jgi:hypothetical protein
MRCQPGYFRSGRLKNAKPIMLRMILRASVLFLLLIPFYLGRGYHYHPFHKVQNAPVKSIVFP